VLSQRQHSLLSYSKTPKVLVQTAFELVTTRTEDKFVCFVVLLFFLSEIGQHEKCHLGFNPAHAVVTREGNPNIDGIITILEKMSEKYGSNQTNATQFQLFNSTKYSMSSGNLMFKDSATELVGIPKEKRTYVKFLGDDYVKDSEALTSCPPPPTTSPKVPTSSVGGAPFVSFLLVAFSALLAMIST